ncbi:SDR family NAD(P)-dependent oxidoreductase [Brevundimonas sp.]|uniref:SDR family NAD(P)-dependent oxidoreductase n=1 Tax=Brevundimonas sp. TaxID=1871086 RepID=UPI002ABA7BC0|nr:SDR family NAD(P)-dependent oxidoreductase [Brevundimonas sp.]MDZ4363310.1 SDR family NAD(P)-dependent oxidoreductase [Brevundimonas sp.]
MASSPFDLTGRTALVTGASSGLGARFARMLAAQGVNVVAGARRLDRLQSLADAVRADGGRIEPVEMDVEDEASIIAAYDHAEATFGTVDLILANAGINAQGPATDLPSDDLGQLMRINVQGVYLTAREGARRLIASPDPSRGRIILLGSVGSLRPLAGLTAYSASKAGVAMLGKGLAREWARHGINVNTICPGWIVTELNAEWLAGEGGQKLIKSFPRRRVMNPEDLDGLVTFLASEASRTITGGVFAADDGQVLA